MFLRRATTPLLRTRFGAGPTQRLLPRLSTAAGRSRLSPLPRRMSTVAEQPTQPTMRGRLRQALVDLKEDKGRILMNVGAVASLTGFMMSDVLHLRLLSIFGSCCGCVFNFTRSPRQLNGVAWGCFFISTNVVMVYKLLQERKEIKFTERELELYNRRFRNFDVKPHTYFKLLGRGEWRTLEEGEKLASPSPVLLAA